MPVFNNALAGAAGSGGAADYKIERSLRFNSGDSSNLQKQFSSSGNTKKWTWSAWVKFNNNSGTQVILNCADGNNFHSLYLNANGTLKWDDVIGGSDVQLNKITNQLFRDFSAWYHIVLVVDTAQATAANRNRMYVNGVQATFASGNDFAQNDNSQFNQGSPFTNNIGSGASAASPLSAFLADVHFIDGQALAPTDFGEFDADTGVWNPKEYAGTYGAKHNGNWVGDTTGTAFNSSHSADKAFDGSTSTSAAPAAGGALTFTPSTAITGITKVRIHAQRDNSASSATVTLNGTDISSNWSNGDDKTVEITTDNLTSLAWTTQSNGQWFAVRKIEIYYSGAYYTLAPNNSFYLKFADNSSNAALGNDAAGSNDWTVNGLTSTGTATSYRTSELSENHASGSVALPFRAFDAAYISSKINTSTWALSTTAWDGAYSSARAELRWIPTGGYAVSNSLRVYYGCYDNTTKTTTLTITYTDGSTETDSMTSGSNNWMKLFTASNAAGKTVQKVELSPSTPSLTNTQFGGFVIDNAIVESLNVNTDSFVDSPTGYEASSGNNGGNYATLNPLINGSSLSNGNLHQANSSVVNYATIGVSSSKFYWETEVVTQPSGGLKIGVAQEGATQELGGQSYTWAILAQSNLDNGKTISNNTLSSSSYTTFAVGDIINHAIDMDSGKIWWGKNGTWLNSGNPVTGANAFYTNLSGTVFPAATATNGGALNWNFGQRPFAISSVPTGFKSLCTQNLPDPLIADGSDYFATTLYNGNQTAKSITTGHAPDFVWLKVRNQTNNHFLFDSVRGVGRRLMSSGNNTEDGNSTTDTLTSFNSDGFSLGADTATGGVNANSAQMVAWTWGGGNLVQSSNNLQTETWSAATGALAAECFDGNTSTQGAMVNEQWYKIAGSLTVSSSMQIYLRKDEQYKMRINGGTEFNANTRDTSISNNYDWAAISIPTGTHTNVEIRITGGGGYINAIKVDGKLMIDPGIIPRGANNTYDYNQGATWSSMFSPTPSGGNGDRTFNGQLYNQGGYLNGGGSWIPTGGLVYYDKVEVIDDIAQKYAVNGGTQAAIATGQWVTLASTTNTNGATLTSIDFTRITDPSTTHTPLGIKIDGKLLVNSGLNVDTPSLNSVVRANPAAGFSVVTWTASAAGSRIAHGLNKKPEMIIAKSRTATQPWVVYHSALGKGGVLQLHGTDGNITSYSEYWGANEPTSTVFGVYTGQYPWANNDGNMVAYCFTSVEGYSAVSSYTSTGGDNFIYTGFRPAFLICKKVVNSSDSSYESWIMFDSERGSYNINQESLYANRSYVEGKRGQDGTVTSSDFGVDFLSNGFAFKNNATEYNRADSSTYIYYAVAENPFKTARAR